MKRLYLWLWITVLLADTLLAATPKKPNFIIINVDDLGYADIGPFGSKNATPHLDRMAREGLKLTSHYSAPVCTPSRAALMTGCYPKRALPVAGVLFPGSAIGLHPDEQTIADVLQAAGYGTACIGKWHLGDQPEFLPTRQGFDSYFGVPYSNDMGPAADGAKSNFGEPLPALKRNPKPLSDDGTGIKGAARQPPLPLVENEKAIERVRADEQATLTARYTERAKDFVRRHQKKPFFLYLAHTAVHFPLYPSKAFRGKSGRGLHDDWVQEVDDSTGQILDLLRELKLDQKTLVIFTSDNGGPTQHGANNGPLRGGKASTFEGGVRSCTLAWWPGQIPAESSSDEITSMMDILPTFAGLAGAKLSRNRRIDGVDLWPLLSGKSKSSGRDTFYYFRGLSLEAVRHGPWKLNLQTGELFHLQRNLGENQNVAPGNAEMVDKLKMLAGNMDHDLGTNGVGKGCRIPGRVNTPKPLLADQPEKP